MPARTIHRLARQGISEQDSFGCGVARRNLIACNDGKFAGRDGSKVLGEAIQRTRNRGAVDVRNLADVDARHLLHDIHRQRKEYRSGRWGLAVMKRATNQNGNLIGMRHLSRPLHRRRCDADEISVEERVR